MSMWRMRKASRGVAAAAVAAGLVLSVAGCSGDGDDDSSKKDSSEQSKDDGSGQQQAGGETEEPVAVIKSSSEIVLTITEAVRDSGGFVTINGDMENQGSEDFVDTPWGGNEEGLAGESLAGATLVDKAGKKRYYVLRDTESRCLCTTNIPIIEAGKSIPVYMQFPAPPDETEEIEFQLPTFPPTTIPLSE